jgi:hypothetical protein
MAYDQSVTAALPPGVGAFSTAVTNWNVHAVCQMDRLVMATAKQHIEAGWPAFADLPCDILRSSALPCPYAPPASNRVADVTTSSDTIYYSRLEIGGGHVDAARTHVEHMQSTVPPLNETFRAAGRRHNLLMGSQFKGGAIQDCLIPINSPLQLALFPPAVNWVSWPTDCIDRHGATHPILIMITLHALCGLLLPTPIADR